MKKQDIDYIYLPYYSVCWAELWTVDLDMYTDIAMSLCRYYLCH